MITQLESPAVNRQMIINALSRIRQEWEGIEENSLVDTQVSLGLILTDIVNALHLTPAEQTEALGPSLTGDLECFLAETVTLNNGRD